MLRPAEVKHTYSPCHLRYSTTLTAGALLDFSHQSRHPAVSADDRKQPFSDATLKSRSLFYKGCGCAPGSPGRQAFQHLSCVPHSDFRSQSCIRSLTKHPPEQQPRSTCSSAWSQDFLKDWGTGVLRWLGHLHWAGWLPSQCWEHILLSGLKYPWNKDEKWQHQAMTTALLRL